MHAEADLAVQRLLCPIDPESSQIAPETRFHSDTHANSESSAFPFPFSIDTDQCP